MIRAVIRTTSPSLVRRFSTTPRRLQDLLPTSKSPIVSKLDFFNSVTGSDQQIPTYRVLDGAGKPIEGAVLPEVRFPFFPFVVEYI